MSRLITERARQTKLMLNVAKLIQIAVSYGAHILFENPTHSTIWEQPFMKLIESIVAEKHVTRSFLLNRCRVGKRFKQFKFFTSLSAEHTNHIETTNNHHFKHPPCKGRDANGNSVDKTSSVYTDSMIHMVVAAIGLANGMDNAVKVIGNGLHKENRSKHESFRCEQECSFEDASHCCVLSLRYIR